MTLRTLRNLLFLLPALLAAACATPGPVLIESVGTMRAGLSVAREQTSTVFADVEASMRETSIRVKVDDPRLSLRESEFPYAIGAETTGQWMAAFDVFDRYLTALQKLVDPARANRTATELNALGTELQDGPLAVRLPKGTAPVFAQLGRAFMQISAERSAAKAMAKADPAVQLVFSTMADAIGTSNDQDLRGTVWAFWNERVADVTADYAHLEPSQADQRRKAIERFLSLRDQRDKDIARLVNLRASFLALGEMHAAAARGDGGTALFWIGRLSDWLKDAKAGIDAEGRRS
ncbi:MAG: hypothetical protein V4574_15115 [Pseudomonadota bacterium]